MHAKWSQCCSSSRKCSGLEPEEVSCAFSLKSAARRSHSAATCLSFDCSVLSADPWALSPVGAFHVYFSKNRRARAMLDAIVYQRLPQFPPQLPRHPPPPRTSLMISSSISAPMVALMIAATMPEPTWIPS
jgi:hypothetical protein